MISFYKSSLLTEQNEHAAALLQDVQGDAALLKVRRSQCHGSIVMLLVFNHLPFRQEELEDLALEHASTEAENLHLKQKSAEKHEKEMTAKLNHVQSLNNAVNRLQQGTQVCT